VGLNGVGFVIVPLKAKKLAPFLFFSTFSCVKSLFER
jgi:hypothetical protein